MGRLGIIIGKEILEAVACRSTGRFAGWPRKPDRPAEPLARRATGQAHGLAGRGGA